MLEQDQIIPLPWETRECFTKNCWCSIVATVGSDTDSMDGCVAASGCLRDIDAKYIVKACNAYPILIKVLEEIEQRLQIDDVIEVDLCLNLVRKTLQEENE